MAPVVETSEPMSFHVVPGSADGWDVVVEREHHVVSSTHCSDWHRVERICAALERQQRQENAAAVTTRVTRVS
jgi:hypothetical protein